MKKLLALAAAAVLGLAGLALTRLADAGEPARQASKPTRIGIVGTGNIGGALAEHWVKAGHEVMMSGLDAESLQPLATRLGPKARVGTPREAAAYGEVLLVSVPYNALPQIGRDYAAEMKGKVVLETGNPYPRRDGPMADEARKRGTGAASSEYLPGVRLVRAFNAISAPNLRGQAFRSGGRVAIPIAGDDAAALQVASGLVRDAGFEPVVVGDLSKARLFDVDTKVYVQVLDAATLRKELGLAP